MLYNAGIGHIIHAFHRLRQLRDRQKYKTSKFKRLRDEYREKRRHSNLRQTELTETELTQFRAEIKVRLEREKRHNRRVFFIAIVVGLISVVALYFFAQYILLDYPR